MQDDTLPTVNMAIGDKFTDVVENSSYKFDKSTIEDMDDNSLYDIQDPVEFHYVDGKYSFTPPAPSHLVWISQELNYVHKVIVSLPLEALSLDEAYELAMKTIQVINQTAWEVNSDRTAVSLERLAEIYTNARKRQYAMPLQEWHNGDTKMILYVKRINKEGTVQFGVSIDEDTYILNLHISNFTLDKKFTKPLYDARQEINNSNDPVPLKY